MAKGTCKICGCTDNKACDTFEFGPCWWVDGTQELCSHCVELKDFPEVIRPFPEIYNTNKDRF